MQLLAALALALSCFASPAQAKVPPALFYSDCAAKGYAPGTLPCSTCAHAAVALGAADAAVKDCHACCTASLDRLPGGRRYAKARLFVSVAGARDGVREFLEKSRARYEAAGLLTIEDVGSPEALLTLHGDEDPKGLEPLSVGVSNWKIEAIEAFLDAKLGGGEDE